MIEFDIYRATVEWLPTSYLLVLGILIPISGLLIRRFKTKRIFVTALVFSIIGLVLSANSPNFTVLLLGRIIQACGTGLATPILFNTILVISPANRRGVAMGTISLVMMFARRQLTLEEPILNVRVFKHPMFVMG